MEALAPRGCEEVLVCLAVARYGVPLAAVRGTLCPCLTQWRMSCFLRKFITVLKDL